MTSKVLKSMNSKFNKICVHIYMNVYINTYIKIYFRYIANITPCPVTPFKGVLRKSCSENMQEIYRRTPMPKCNFNKVASNFVEITHCHGCYAVNLLHIFRTSFPENTSGGLLLYFISSATVF